MKGWIVVSTIGTFLAWDATCSPAALMWTWDCSEAICFARMAQAEQATKIYPGARAKVRHA